MRRAWLLALSLTFTGASTPRVAVHLQVAVAQAPACVRVRVTIDPHEDDRALRVDLVGEDFYRASEVPLDGVNGPKTTWIEWQDVPGGDYEVVARVATTTKIDGMGKATMHILSRFGGW